MSILEITDKINITTASGQYIDYTYDADGNLLRKRAYSGGALQTTTDYIDGFVYITVTTGTPALSYFPMPEGRVVNVSGTLTQEFIMTDQQGNARVAFRNVGGIAKVFQENSYYGTGLILPNSPVGTPAVANKKLYNGGSEWQNDSPSGTYNLPDYYETFNRNYDATIGRFIGVDPMAESAESLSSYQYAGCNPIVGNDPDGDIPMPNPPRAISGPNTGEFAGIEAQYDAQDEFWSNFYGVGWQGNFIYGGQDVTSQYVGAGPVIGTVSAAEYQEMQASGHSGLNYHFGTSGKLEWIAPNESDENTYEQETTKYLGYLFDPLTEDYIILQRNEPEAISGQYAAILMNLYNGGSNAHVDAVNQEATANNARGNDNTITNVASGIATGLDAEGVAIAKGNVIMKLTTGASLSGKAFKAFTHSGTVVGLIAGGAPAIYNIATGNGTWRDWVALGLAGLGAASEFTGLGEAYDGTVGLGIAAGSLAYDIYDATHTK